jgi:activator of HSP90 ATPase
VSSGIVVALRVAATPARAFAVFTGEIEVWWRPNELFEFTPRGAGKLAFSGGLGGRLIETLPTGEVFEIGEIAAWEPGVRVAFSWRQASFTGEQVTQVEVRFEPVGSETRVTVEHHGWDTVPQQHVARHTFPNAVFLRRHGEWWQALLLSFAAVVTRAVGRAASESGDSTR